VTFKRDPSGRPGGLVRPLEGLIAAKGTTSEIPITEDSRPSGEGESHEPKGGREKG
jgi:hypothetical protein